MIAIVAHKRKSLGAVSCMGGSLTVPTAQSSRIPPICGSTTVPDDTLRLKGGADPLGDDYATMRTAWLSGNAGGSHSSPGRPAVSLAGQPAAALPANAGGSYSSPGMPATSPSGHSASALQAKQKQTRPPWFHGAKARSPAERAAVGGARGRGGGCRIVLSLSTNTTFAAKSSFPPKGVTEAYTRAGGRYDGEQKRWVFPLEKYEWVVEELGALKRSGQVKLDEIPPKILEAFRAAAGEQPPPLQILAAGASQDKDKAGGEAVDDAAVALERLGGLLRGDGPPGAEPAPRVGWSSPRGAVGDTAARGRSRAGVVVGPGEAFGDLAALEGRAQARRPA